jgi:LacI family transcriptional regulator
MIACPHCHQSTRQVKAGISAGIQRYKCAFCQRRYTLESRTHGYSDELRRQAAHLYAQGKKIREIARQLGVNHQTVANWVHQQADSSAVSPLEASPDKPATVPAKPPTPGKRRLTINDVAERAGVSTSTISNYLNAKGRMSEATRARIRAAIDELHFTPSALIRAIRRRHTNILGLLIFGMANIHENVDASLGPPLLAGIYDAATTAGQDILLYTGWPDLPERHSGLDFLNGQIDGMLWVAPEIHTPALERIAVAGLPVVALLTRHVPEGTGYVNTDNIAAMQALVAHLAEQGRRRIAFIGPTYSSNFLDRLEGYRQGLASVGLPHDPALERAFETDWWQKESYERALDAWFALPDPPDAIITQDDGWASVICKLVHARGLRVPKDIAITGFDDIPRARTICGGLTTIRQPFRQMGQIAVERLLALIEGASIEVGRVTVPGELVVRTSTVTQVAATALLAADEEQ